MRYHATIVLAVIPLLVFGAHALSRPSPPLPIKPVQTEGVRMIRMDTQTFRARWMPVNDMPPAMRGGDAPARAASKPVEAAARPLPPAARIVKRAALRTDICSKHGMRRHYYTGRGGWQHWKCRR
jgi:hypothetical protein